MYNYFLHLRTSLIIKRKNILSYFLTKNSDYTPFIILCEPRTGSTLLHTYLNFHPHVKSYGEILREQTERRHHYTFSIRKDIFKPHGRHLHAVGLKAFYYYFDHPAYAESFRELIDKKACKVIHIHRRDVFKLYVSLKMAQKTSQWSTSKSNKRKDVRIFVNIDDFRQFARTYGQRKAFFRSLFSDHDMLDISYEDLQHHPDTELEKVQDFLKIKPRRLQSLLKKQNPDELELVVVNYQEIKAAVKEIINSIPG